MYADPLAKRTRKSEWRLFHGDGLTTEKLLKRGLVDKQNIRKKTGVPPYMYV